MALICQFRVTGFYANQGKLLKTKVSFLRTKVSSEKNVTYLELRAYLGQKKPVAQKYIFIAISFYCNIFLLQYLFIAISFYRNIFLLQYLFIAISFYHNIFLSQYLFIAISFYHNIFLLQYLFIAISFYRNIFLSQYCV